MKFVGQLEVSCLAYFVYFTMYKKMTDTLIVLDFSLFPMCPLGVGPFFRGKDWIFGDYRAQKLGYVKCERYRPHPIDFAQRPQELNVTTGVSKSPDEAAIVVE